MRRIWAVARVTLREALRQKTALALLVLLAILLPSLGFVRGDETLPGRAQMFLDWSLRISRLVLGLMTIFIACGSIAWELKYKQAYITLVKPIPRWQFVLGKWLGIGLLNLALLIVVGLIIEGFAWQFRGRPDLGYDKQSGIHWKLDKIPITGLTQQQRDVEQREREILNREVLVARQSLPLVSTERLAAEVESEFQRKIAAGEMPPDFTAQRIRDEIRAKKIYELGSVPANKSRDFLFTDLSTARREGGFIQIRYMIIPDNATPNDVMSYWWRLGDKTKVLHEDVPAINEPVRTVHTIRVRADVISDDGQLKITFVNVNPLDPKQTYPSDVLFAGDGSLEVLYPVGGFEANLMRAMLLLLVQMLFLAAIGLFASSFLTFPTACLMCLVVFAASSGVSYLLEALSWTYRDETAVVSHGISRVTGPLVSIFLHIVPDFSAYSPADALVDGKMVAWSLNITPSVGLALLDVGIRMTLVLLVGCWIFTRREVAEVVV